DSVYAGSEFRVLVTLGSGAGLIIRRSASQGGLRPGTPVRLGWATDRARLLPA
ncbi:MAG: TOBE domain-containing protein, partial [Acetobacteraceae bacterium]